MFVLVGLVLGFSLLFSFGDFSETGGNSLSGSLVAENPLLDQELNQVEVDIPDETDGFEIEDNHSLS